MRMRAYDLRVTWWPWRRREAPSALVSIGDPALAEWFAVGTPNYAGVPVGEGTALGLSAVYRAVALISQTIASLPLRTLRDTGDGMRQRMVSVFDQPGGPNGPTRFEWVETLMVHLLLHGNAFALHRFNAAAGLAGLQLVHPLLVTVDEPRPDDPRPPAGGKWLRVTDVAGQVRSYDAAGMTHIPALSVDGLRGLSPISVARNSLGTAIAGDRAAAKMFAEGPLFSGILTPEEDVTEEEATAIKDGLNARAAGWENASSIAVVNRKLKFTPWTMSAEDAQFLQSRQFQVEEVARWFGIPPHALMQTEKQTSWGTGVAEQNRGLSRTVLAPWAKRVEERLSRLLPAPRFVEFDFAGLERGSPEQEIDLLIKQVAAGLLTVDEARAIRNLPPLPKTETPSEPERGDEREPVEA